MKTLPITELSYDKKHKMFLASATLLVTKGIAVEPDEFLPFEHINREFLLVNPVHKTKFVFVYTDKYTSSAGVFYNYTIKNAPEKLKGLRLSIASDFPQFAPKTTKEVYTLFSGMKDQPAHIKVASGWFHQRGQRHYSYEVFENGQRVTDPVELGRIYNELNSVKSSTLQPA